MNSLLHSRTAFTLTAVLGAALTSAAVAQDTCSASKTASTCSTTPMAAAGPRDIVQTAVSAGSFKTLAAALEAADLVDALQGDGPFTVFAPTDDAFAQLPKGTVETLLKPENKGLLTAILTYHVVPGRLMSTDVAARTQAITLNNQRVTIGVENGVRIDEANVIKADIACTNGVIHVIDRVIMPETKNLVELAVAAGSFETLTAAVKAAGLAGALSGDDAFTVFAPTDAAFARLPEGTVATLLEPANKHKLASILKYHVVPGRVFAKDALYAESAETLEGQRLRFKLNGSGLMVNGAAILQTDIEASNGVVHIIDTVLLPG